MCLPSQCYSSMTNSATVPRRVRMYRTTFSSVGTNDQQGVQQPLHCRFDRPSGSCGPRGQKPGKHWGPHREAAWKLFTKDRHAPDFPPPLSITTRVRQCWRVIDRCSQSTRQSHRRVQSSRMTMTRWSQDWIRVQSGALARLVKTVPI